MTSNFTFVQCQPCVPYTDNYDLLSWVRDENNADDHLPEIGPFGRSWSGYWETGGKLYCCPGNAVYRADGDPSKVQRLYIVTESPQDGVSRIGSLYPPNWLDRPATV